MVYTLFLIPPACILPEGFFFEFFVKFKKNTYILGMEEIKKINGFVHKPDLRERLLERGPESLNDSELMAILLRTGLKDKPVKALAEDIIFHIDKIKPEKIEGYLRSVKGMGDSKIASVMAAMELGRRYYNTQGRVIEHPSDVVPLLQHYAGRSQEHFICVSLNGANEVIAARVVSIGILTKTLVHPREVFSDVIKDRAASVIVAHNHPSGNLLPSREDILLTNRLYEAGNILGIKLLDHIILVPSGDYYSFIQNEISLSEHFTESGLGGMRTSSNY